MGDPSPTLGGAAIMLRRHFGGILGIALQFAAGSTVVPTMRRSSILNWLRGSSLSPGKAAFEGRCAMTLHRWIGGILTTTGTALLVAVGPAAVQAVTLYAIAGDGVLYDVSQVDASLTAIGQTGLTVAGGEPVGGLEFGPDGTLYGETFPGHLYEIDPNTGTSTFIGSLTNPDTPLIEGGLAFSDGGEAYVVSYWGDIPDNILPPTLIRIDISTGELLGGVAIQGALEGETTHDYSALQWRSDGVLVAVDSTANALITIDPITGATSVIGAVPEDGGRAGLVTVGGTSYLGTGGTTATGSGTNSLYTIDLFTGALSLIGSFAPVPTDFEGEGIWGLAAVPEPSATFLLATGLAGLIWRTRSRAHRHP
jgi:outer membrane protein assembly factor BamB